MRILFIFLILYSVTSCSIIYNGVIKNNYLDSITVDSSRGVRGSSVVGTNETTEVPIFSTKEGTCIAVTDRLQTKFYLVPSPPAWSKISGMWNVKFGLSVSTEGAYYVGKNGESQKLNEVSSCDT